MKDRIWEIDALRGFCIVLMVIYHLLYDLQFVFGRVLININTPFFSIASPFFAGLFIFISGICSNFSKNNLKRGIILLFIAMGVFVVTFIYDADEAICFGILHLLAVCMIISHFILKYHKKMPAIYLLISVIIIAGGFFTEKIMPATNIFVPLGFHTQSFASLDYFPLIPWLGVFLLGIFAGQRLYKNRTSRLDIAWHFPTLSFAGRQSLLIYILHQPLIMGILTLGEYL